MSNYEIKRRFLERITTGAHDPPESIGWRVMLVLSIFTAVFLIFSAMYSVR